LLSLVIWQSQGPTFRNPSDTDTLVFVPHSQTSQPFKLDMLASNATLSQSFSAPHRPHFATITAGRAQKRTTLCATLLPMKTALDFLPPSAMFT
jgi:hypothetical protein